MRPATRPLAFARGAGAMSSGGRGTVRRVGARQHILAPPRAEPRVQLSSISAAESATPATKHSDDIDKINLDNESRTIVEALQEPAARLPSVVGLCRGVCDENSRGARRQSKERSTRPRTPAPAPSFLTLMPRHATGLPLRRPRVGTLRGHHTHARVLPDEQGVGAPRDPR